MSLSLSRDNLGDVISVYYVSIDKEPSYSEYVQLLSLLNDDMIERNSRYLFSRNRYQDLYGKLLLIIALNNLGYNRDYIKNIKYTKYNRPFFIDNLDFNISHSEKMVMCAISKTKRIGIDVEKIREIDMNNFLDIMSKEQWEQIYSNRNPNVEFFKIWTIKESVIKADGRGLVLPLKDIRIVDNRVFLEKNCWRCQYGIIDDLYYYSLSTRNCEQLTARFIKCSKCDFMKLL